MLKVLQLIPTLDRSGAEKQMVLLAKGLPKHRFAVEVAALTRLGPLEVELREAQIPVALIGKRHKVDPFALRSLTRLLKEKQYDIVQTWIFAANTYGRIAAKLAKTPITIATEMAVDQWKKPAEFAIDRRLAKWSDKVVGNSKAVVEFYRSQGIPENKLECIFSGIGTAEAPLVEREAFRREFEWPNESVIAIFVGRLAEQKAVDDLLRALDLLRHVRPSLRTLIVGDGPNRELLQAMSKSFELDEYVRFLGHRDDVPRLIAGSDMLVLPSLYEGLPNVVLEAMRFGKPIVATSAPGTTEAVEHEKTGLLSPVRDFKELARSIRRLVDDPELARNLGRGGFERVDQAFRIDDMIERFAALYETLAREKLPADRMKRE